MSQITTLPSISTTATGGATSDNQTNGLQKTQVVDGSGNVITSTNVGGSRGMNVDVLASALPTGAASAAKQPALGTAGTASADVISVQGIASMTALTVAQATGTNLHTVVDATGTSTANATVTSATTLFTMTTAGYGQVSVQTIISATATITFECSNDNSTWVAVSMGYVTAGAPTTVTSSSNVFWTPVNFNYFRVRCSAYTNGNVTAYAMATAGSASTDPALRNIQVSNTVGVSQSGTWTVQPGNTANTTAWKVDGSAVTQPVSGTFFQATQPVSIASQTRPINTTGSASLTAGQTSIIDTSTLSIVQIYISGTWTGNLAWDIAIDTTNYSIANGVSCQALDGQVYSGVDQTSLATLGPVYKIDVAGTQRLRLSAAGGNTGTVTVAYAGISGGDMTQAVLGTTYVAGSVNCIQADTWTVYPGNIVNTTAWLVKEETSGTATLTNVNDSASSQSLLASNSSRKGAMFFNDTTVGLYLKLGTTASTTSFTVLIPAQGYYELPANPSCYTGAIDGIWASNASGAVRITELT